MSVKEFCYRIPMPFNRKSVDEEGTGIYRLQWRRTLSVEGKLTKHKAVDITVACLEPDLFQAHFAHSSKVDHAGLNVYLCLLGLSVEFLLYDVRHWDNKRNCWKEDER